MFTDPQILEWMAATVARRDRRYWSTCHPDFERDAVRAAFQDIKKHFDKRDIKQRIAASKAQTFVELRLALGFPSREYKR